MKSILKLAFAFSLPFTVLSCGEKEEKKTDTETSTDSTPASLETHEAIIKEYHVVGASIADKMGAVKDKASAMAFGEAANATLPKLKSLLESAEALPAPSAEDKASFAAESEKVEAQMMKNMMALQKEMTENPLSEEDQQEFSAAMENIMNGEDGQKIEAVTQKIEAIYGTE